jgi:hypothetical protein
MIFHGYTVHHIAAPKYYFYYRFSVHFLLNCPSDTEFAFVRYTVDGWKNYKDAYAEKGNKFWIIKVPLGDEDGPMFDHIDGLIMEFAFCIQPKEGFAFWDNNESKNYLLYDLDYMRKALPEKCLGDFDETDGDVNDEGFNEEYTILNEEETKEMNEWLANASRRYLDSLKKTEN